MTSGLRQYISEYIVAILDVMQSDVELYLQAH